MQDFFTRNKLHKYGIKGLEIKLRKKFHGIELKDFYKLASKVTEYLDLLKEKNCRRKSLNKDVFSRDEP